MMTQTLRIFAILALFFAAALGADEKTPAPAPADFKLLVRHYGIRKEPISAAEVVFRNGVAYQFDDDEPSEVVIIDPAQARLGLLDLKLKIQAELTPRSLDAALDQLHRRTTAQIEAREKLGGKANRVTAAKNRDLIDSHLKETFDPAARSVRLTNPSLEIDARGVLEPDKPRTAAIVNAQAALAKLGALRKPEKVPPFAYLQTLDALAVRQGLRPVEISILYRLAGPPRRFRREFTLVPQLTDREREAIARIDHLRTTARLVRYEQYEQAGEP